ncbi:MAG: helix-turn-helix domain-containing protein [Myxococcales bacterium]|nr:helix-turn-helix domain-containing protein [Myxococcales bacterium]
MGHREIFQLRARLGLSRSELARFLGVSEPTVVRWESGSAISEPKGLQALLLRALADASGGQPASDVARIVRSCGLDHRAALADLLAATQYAPSALSR